MSGIIGWIKSHLLIVISIVVILAVVPAGYFGSSIMNKGIKEEADKKFKDEQSALARSERVNYTLPRVLEGEQPLEVSRAPNRRITEYLAEIKASRDEQVSEIVERAEAFNSQGADLLIEDLFPEAQSEIRERTLTRDLARVIAGSGNREGAYGRLVRRLGGGEPTDQADVQGILSSLESERLELMGAGDGGRTLTAEQKEELQGELASQRVGLYAGRAAELTFYTVPGLFGEGRRAAGSPIPTSLDVNAQTPPTIEQAFTWQWDYWAIGAVLRGIAAANSDASGPVGVAESPIKRVDLIEVSPLVLPAPDDGSSRRRSDEGAGSLPPSHTGRAGESSPDYDVRVVTVEAIVAPKRLPAFFDALARTNFMTVTSLDLTETDPWDAIGQGYYYGSDHVMHARMRIETAWLRSWTGPLMPPSVREALGVVLPEAGTPEGTGGEDGFGDGFGP